MVASIEALPCGCSDIVRFVGAAGDQHRPVGKVRELRGGLRETLDWIAPRRGGCARMHDNERRIERNTALRKLEILLDEAFPIPGTRIRFGLDAIVGIVPGIGDVLAGLASIVFPLAGWVRGLPYITLVRMVANVGIGVPARPDMNTR